MYLLLIQARAAGPSASCKYARSADLQVMLYIPKLCNKVNMLNDLLLEVAEKPPRGRLFGLFLSNNINLLEFLAHNTIRI